MRPQIRLLKSIDGFIAPLIRLLSPRPSRPVVIQNLKRILIIRPGGIGDAALLVPALIALEKAFPWICVDVLAEKRNAEVFSLYPRLNRVYLYDSPRDLIELLRKNYDAVIDTEQWHRLSAIIAMLTKTPILIGYATNERKQMLTHQIEYSHDDFEMDIFFRLLLPFRLEERIRVNSPYYSIPLAAEMRVRDILGSLSEKIFIAIFPGASIREKRWNVERFEQIADHFAQKGIPVVVIGGKSEILAGKRILAGKSGLNLAGETSLAESAAVIGNAAVLVSGDSGLLHLAAGLGRPTVSLFGPSNIRKWAPRGEHHITISMNLSCSPCSKYGYTPKCPKNVLCMNEINVADVIAAVEKLLRVNSRVG